MLIKEAVLCLGHCILIFAFLLLTDASRNIWLQVLFWKEVGTICLRDAHVILALILLLWFSYHRWLFLLWLHNFFWFDSFDIMVIINRIFKTLDWSTNFILHFRVWIVAATAITTRRSTRGRPSCSLFFLSILTTSSKIYYLFWIVLWIWILWVHLIFQSNKYILLLFLKFKPNVSKCIFFLIRSKK